MKHETSRNDGPPARVRVYKYGLLPPREPLDGILEEDRKLIALWNSLVEVGEASRKEWEALLDGNRVFREASLRLAVLRGELEAARKRRRESGRRGAPKEDRDAASDALLKARTAFREGLGRMRDARKTARLAISTKTEELTRTRDEAIRGVLKRARDEGLHWSSAEALVERWKTAWAQALAGRGGFPRLKAGAESPLPYVFRYTGGGCPLTRLFSARSSILRITLPPTSAPPEGMGPARRARWHRRQGRGRVLVAIGGRPYDFGIVMHRRPPEGSLLKKAEVSRALRAPSAPPTPPRWDWHLCLTVEEPAVAAVRHPRPGSMVAFAMGWRRVETRLRVGVLLTTAGEREDLWLPEKLQEREDRAKGVQVDMDADLNEMKGMARPALDRLAAQDEEVRRLKDAWERVRSGGLRRLAARLEARGEDSEFLRALGRWEHRRIRRLTIRRGIFRHLKNHRSWWWQNTALVLSRRFETIVVLDADLEGLKRRPAPEDGAVARKHSASAAGQQLAALHEGLRWLKLMAGKCGGGVRAIPAAFMSLRCSRCGACRACSGPVEPCRAGTHGCEGRAVEQEPHEYEFRCPSCALVLDRAENTASNLLAASRG